MPRLLQNERERAVGMFQAGMTQIEIANHFNFSRMTIYRLFVRVKATGTTSDRRRSGRPRAYGIALLLLWTQQGEPLVYVATEFLNKQFVIGCVSLVSVHVAHSKVWS